MQDGERKRIETREALMKFGDLNPSDLWERRVEIVRTAENQGLGNGMSKFIKRVEMAERPRKLHKAFGVLMRELGMPAEVHTS